MIRHIVMWKLRDPLDAGRFKLLLDRCQGLVAGMLEFEVAIRSGALDATVDVVLVSTFADAAAFDGYQQHHHRQAVSAQPGPLRASRNVLDYPLPVQ